MTLDLSGEVVLAAVAPVLAAVVLALAADLVVVVVRQKPAQDSERGLVAALS